MRQKTVLCVALQFLALLLFISACRNGGQFTIPAAAFDTATFTVTSTKTVTLPPDTPTQTRTGTAVQTSTQTPQDTKTETPAGTPSSTNTCTNTTVSPGTPTSTATATYTPASPDILKETTYFGKGAPFQPTPYPTFFSPDPEYAQMMKASSSYTITRVEAYLFGVGLPYQPGNIWAEIQGVTTVAGGKKVPDGIPIINGISPMLNINTTLTTNMTNKVVFYFSGCPVANGQDYGIVFKWDSGQAMLLQFPAGLDMYPDGQILITGVPPAPFYHPYYDKWNSWWGDDMFIDVYGY